MQHALGASAWCLAENHSPVHSQTLPIMSCTPYPFGGNAVTGEVRQWTRDDFEFKTDVTGELPDGSSRTVPVYGLKDDVVYTGGTFATNGDSEHEYLGITASFTKRLANRWQARGHFTWNDWNWNIGSDSRLHDDPTNTTGDGITASGGGGLLVPWPRGHIRSGRRP